jgi:peptidoglycan-N-acetylglucosamine deacetylase
MKRVFILLLLLTVAACHSPTEAELSVVSGDQFAKESKTYKPGKDTGFGKYKTASLLGEKKVVLTFDDGPHKTQTPRLLDILKKLDVKATFFVMGDKSKRYPKIIKRMRDEGHIVAMHAFDHKSSNSLTKKKFESSIEESVKIIKEAGWDKKEMYFRFPYGAYGSRKLSYHHMESLKKVSKRLYKQNCFNFVFWDVDTSDWYLRKLRNTKAKIIETVFAYLEGGRAWDFYYYKKYKRARKIKREKALEGGVILLHDIHKSTVDSVEPLVNKLREHNYEIVPLNEVEEFEYQDNLVCNLNH